MRVEQVIVAPRQHGIGAVLRWHNQFLGIRHNLEGRFAGLVQGFNTRVDLSELRVEIRGVITALQNRSIVTQEVGELLARIGDVIQVGV
ncbi:hypothetical protein PBR20603_02850 [Pandoraea bronchicola]|uniref:Uncharacterized protein n=1 Tax=Pandoraea bronchicola TaxID=2508287 RepID=A0A5E5BU87_9BURK|nr:hypothetical protein PBR20603_02850 [Pandoraea bronchicola]